MTPAMSLAVIVITRNEELVVKDCLHACLEAVRLAKEEHLVAAAEVVLVDSASTDRTREIAATLPVRILAIPASWPLSAAAGRFIGIRHTSSEIILFVDGDFVLNPDWLPIGLQEFEDPTVAGVCGVDKEALGGTTMISRYVAELTARAAPSQARSDAEGIAVGLYRREWIERAGSIQPFLKGAEDRDIAIRVRALGGRLVKTKAEMGCHHWAPGADLNLTEYLRSVARWSYGEGQATRHAAREPSIRRVYLRRYFNLRHLIQLELTLLLCAWSIALLAAILVLSPLAFLAVVLAALAALTATSRALTEPLRKTVFRFHQVPYVIVRLGGFLLGATKRTPPAAEYPWQILG